MNLASKISLEMGNSLKVLAISLVLLILNINKTYAEVVLKEKQEVRYAKALIAFNKKDYKKALHYLGENLNYKNVHLESIELLAKIHDKRKNYKKAIRATYYLIKKNGGSHYVKLPFEKKELTSFHNNLEEISEDQKPNKKLLTYFFNLGNFYSNYHDIMKEKFEKDDERTKLRESKKQREIKLKLKKSGNVKKIQIISKEEKRAIFLQKNLILAEKYLQMVLYFKFSTSYSKFLLGLVEQKRGNNYKASSLFQSAYDDSFSLDKEEGSSKNQTSKQDKSLREVLEYYIGDALFQEGHRELATKYFKSLNSNTKNSSLKNYSSLYIDSLSESYLSLNATLGFGIDTNPFQQDASEVSSPEFGERDNYLNKEFNIFYNSNQLNDWAYTLSVNFEENTYLKSIFEAADTRSISAEAEVKFINMPKSITKLSAAVSSSQAKQEESDAFSSFSSATILTFAHDRYLKNGILGFSIPITLSSLNTTSGTATSTQASGAISYTPWAKTKYYRPVYSLNFGQTSTNGIISNSNSFGFSFSNQFSINNKTNVFTTLSTSFVSAEKATESLNSYDLSGLLLYDLDEYINSLILQTKVDASYIREGEVDVAVTRRYRISVNLQVSF